MPSVRWQGVFTPVYGDMYCDELGFYVNVVGVKCWGQWIDSQRTLRKQAGGGYWSVCGRLKLSGRWASYSCLALLLPMSTILCKERRKEWEKGRRREKERNRNVVLMQSDRWNAFKDVSDTHNEPFHTSHLHSAQFVRWVLPMLIHTHKHAEWKTHWPYVSRLN